MSLDTGGPANTNGVVSVTELEGRVREKLECITRAIADLRARGDSLDASEVALLTDLLRNLAAAVDGAESEALGEPRGAQGPQGAGGPAGPAAGPAAEPAAASPASPPAGAPTRPAAGPPSVPAAPSPARPASAPASPGPAAAQPMTPASRRRLRRRGH